MTDPLSGYKDKPLFTPGPLTTSRTVKQAMLRDLGSRDVEFIQTVRSIRERLLGLAGVQKGDYEAVLMQGSGTFSVEAFFSSMVPPEGRVLVLANGAYGERMIRICEVLRIPVEPLRFPENTSPDPEVAARALDADPTLSHVAIVHCETTTGILNPLQAIGECAAARGRFFFVDAMSSFGAVPIDFEACRIGALVSSANKCIEGVPGFGFLLVQTAELLLSKGWARSLSLDLHAQWQGLESNGQFRFTPPTHALLAFHQALLELEAEGGVPGRAARYRKNHDLLVEGMHRLGFREYLDRAVQGDVITSFLYPADSRFDFEDFYRRLNDKGFVIYPGKLSQADCFRIGSIGRLAPYDIPGLLWGVESTLQEMGLPLPLA